MSISLSLVVMVSLPFKHGWLSSVLKLRTNSLSLSFFFSYTMGTLNSGTLINSHTHVPLRGTTWGCLICHFITESWKQNCHVKIFPFICYIHNKSWEIKGGLNGIGGRTEKLRTCFFARIPGIYVCWSLQNLRCWNSKMVLNLGIFEFPVSFILEFLLENFMQKFSIS